MLVQFSVENFLSFNELTVFSMVAANNVHQHPEQIVAQPSGRGNSLLRIAAVYGANAAGKSNLLQAIHFAQNLILRGTKSGRAIPLHPFKFASAKTASTFEFIFLQEGTLYSYGLKLNTNRILEEWLYCTPGTRELKLFERTTSEDGITEVELGPRLKGRSKERDRFLHFVAEGTRPNQPFLTEALDRSVSELAPVMDWFRNALLVISAESRHETLEAGISVATDFTEFVNGFMAASGTGIVGTTSFEQPVDIDKDFSSVPNEVKADLKSYLSDADANSIVVLQTSEGRSYLKRTPEGKTVLLQLRLQHRSADGKTIDFDFDEESEGTQRLLHLLPALFALKKSTAKVILLDELERRLHPLLARLLIRLAQKCGESNPNSQLIFTTHDTNLLDLDLLRRDSIWFVEKDMAGSSHLYSLAEFKIRADLQIEKGYLNGRFGAIPFLGDVLSLCEAR